MEKCKHSRKHKFLFTIWDYSWLCNYSMKRQPFYRSENFCEDHGYSFEWVSGRKPRLTPNGKTTTCRIDNNVPLVVPGLLTSSSGSTSWTSPLRAVFHRSVKRATWCRSYRWRSAFQQKPKTKSTLRNARVMRMIHCKIFQSGCSRSQTI